MLLLLWIAAAAAGVGAEVAEMWALSRGGLHRTRLAISACRLVLAPVAVAVLRCFRCGVTSSAALAVGLIPAIALAWLAMLLTWLIATPRRLAGPVALVAGSLVLAVCLVPGGALAVLALAPAVHWRKCQLSCRRGTDS